MRQGRRKTAPDNYVEVENALRVLPVLADAGPAGQPLREIAKRFMLNKPGSDGVFSALRLEIFVERSSATGFCSLGSELEQVSPTDPRSVDIRETLRLAAQRLAEHLTEVFISRRSTNTKSNISQ